MKYLFIILTICLFSCNESSSHVKKLNLFIHNGSTFWDASTAIIECDSATMLSSKEAIVWINGTKSKVYSDGYIELYNIAY